MNFKNEKESDDLLIQEINSKGKAFTNKIFRYFYELFQEKKDINLFLKFIQFLIETIQLISYPISFNHKDSWKLDPKI